MSMLHEFLSRSAFEGTFVKFFRHVIQIDLDGLREDMIFLFELRRPKLLMLFRRFVIGAWTFSWISTVHMKLNNNYILNHFASDLIIVFFEVFGLSVSWVALFECLLFFVLHLPGSEYFALFPFWVLWGMRSFIWGAMLWISFNFLIS